MLYTMSPARLTFLFVLLSLSAAISAPAAEPTTRRAPARAISSKSLAAVDTAARALAREWNAAHSGGKSKLRTSCSYFQDNHSDDITTEAILASLERAAHDDSPQTSYVKWQLLSGIPGQVPEELAPRALNIYRNFGTLERQPGMEQNSRSDLELRRRSCQESGVADLNKHLADLQTKVNEDNAPVLSFRDELYSKLPVSYDMIAAGFEDAHDRLKAGAESQTIVEKAADAAQSWMSRANPKQLRAMSDALKALEKERGTQYYDSASWSETSRKVTFYKKSPKLDQKVLDALARQLAEQSDSPTPGGLKFKDEKKDKKDKS
jgi:hypothetical protein